MLLVQGQSRRLWAYSVNTQSREGDERTALQSEGPLCSGGSEAAFLWILTVSSEKRISCALKGDKLSRSNYYSLFVDRRFRKQHQQLGGPQR